MLVAVIANSLVPLDSYEIISLPHSSPNVKFLLETNFIGQDVLDELIYVPETRMILLGIG